MDTIVSLADAIKPTTLTQDQINLDNREEMLKTLHLAYSHSLDECGSRLSLEVTGEPLSPEDRRLSSSQQRDLGRRLALYWDIGRDTLPKPQPPVVFRDHNEEIEAMLVQFRKDRSAVNGDEGGEVV